MDLDTILKTIQSAVTETPLIMVGSGASAPHGLPSMHDLGKHLVHQLSACYRGTPCWDNFEANIANDDDLETALTGIELTREVLADIRCETWNLISSRDLAVYEQLLFSPKMLPLTRLLKKFYQAHPRRIDIITTNYDRLIEYACDLAEIPCTVGFDGYYLKHFSGSFADKNSVNLLKVHGSLDVFRDVHGGTDSYTIMSMLLNEHSKDAVLELFRLGWLQVNAFGSKYTMADYIINAASKASEGDGKFLFSWLPVQKDETALLQLIKQAISSSNTAMFSPKENPSKEELWILNSEIEKMKREVSSSGLSLEELKALEKEVNTDYSRRMRDIGEFLSIMVQLSSAGPVIHQKKEINEIRYDYLSLINVILYNTNINWGAMEIDPARRNLILDARKQLQHLRDTSEEDEKKTKLKHQDNRSDWIDALIEIRDVYIESHTRPDVNCLKMANALVDLCYYYAVEESVLNVLKHFKESKLKGIDEQISGQELAYLNDNISRALFTPDEIDTIKKTKEDQNYARISSSAAKKIIKYVNASKLFQNENFIKDFAKRLNEYWDIHKECFLAPDTNSLMKYCSVRYRNIWDYRAIDLPESNEGILHTPDWNLALSLVNGQNPQQPNKIPEFTYEEQTKHFQKSWDRRRRLRYRSKIFSLLFTFMLITILTISETPLDMLAYGIFELDINKVPFFVRVLISVISAFVSSVFISLLSIAISLVMKKVEKIPFETTDILDFYKQIRRTICEVVTIKVLYKKKYRSYHL